MPSVLWRPFVEKDLSLILATQFCCCDRVHTLIDIILHVTAAGCGIGLTFNVVLLLNQWCNPDVELSSSGSLNVHCLHPSQGATDPSTDSATLSTLVQALCWIWLCCPHDTSAVCGDQPCWLTDVWNRGQNLYSYDLWYHLVRFLFVCFLSQMFCY